MINGCTMYIFICNALLHQENISKKLSTGLLTPNFTELPFQYFFSEIIAALGYPYFLSTTKKCRHRRTSNIIHAGQLTFKSEPSNIHTTETQDYTLIPFQQRCLNILRYLIPGMNTSPGSGSPTYYMLPHSGKSIYTTKCYSGSWKHSSRPLIKCRTEWTITVHNGALESRDQRHPNKTECNNLFNP